ncbi:MAG: cytochrome C oxidase subunit IV, partial [Dehalococcoidia bacterium]|nr:cytochrome C oxidase subunit IV [Dehalococcoidia bacterium]
MAHQSEHNEAAPAEEHSHPSPGRYVFIGAVLTIITGIEVAIYGLNGLGKGLPILLIALSAVKFFVVVAFFMHLKFDAKLFT